MRPVAQDLILQLLSETLKSSFFGLLWKWCSIRVIPRLLLSGDQCGNDEVWSDSGGSTGLRS